MRVIELDNNATTRPDPRVIAAVTAAMVELSGNPASSHAMGREAARAVARAREQVAAAVDVSPSQVVVTSGATEANNLAVSGVWQARPSGRRHVVVGATEHPSILASARSLQQQGARVELAPVLRDGRIDLQRLYEIVTEDTLLVSVMAANNETGVLHPIVEVGEIAHAVGAWFHCDATQALGRIPVSMHYFGADLLSLSGHKIHGPRGVGALIVDPDVPLEASLHGGGQERGLRAGTTNTPGLVGLGLACWLKDEHLGQSSAVQNLRDRFWAALQAAVPDLALNGADAPRLPNTLNVRFRGADAEAVLAGLPRVTCSTGSACSAAVPGPSPVLLAMGLDRVAASESIRFSLSVQSSDADVDEAVPEIARAVAHVRRAMGVGAA